VTKRDKSHFFIKYNGFGLNKGLINELLRKGVNRIMIKYYSRNGIKNYLVNTKTVKEKGTPYKHPKFEPQYIINLKYTVRIEYNIIQ
jgi:hypothetical protein